LNCVGCQREPKDIPEYQEAAEREEMAPTEYVRFDEGTYDIQTDMFCCTNCYVSMGMPLNTQLIGMYQHANKK